MDIVCYAVLGTVYFIASGAYIALIWSHLGSEQADARQVEVRASSSEETSRTSE